MRDGAPPKDPRRFLPLLVTAVLGAAVTAGVFLVFSNLEHDQLSKEFEALAVDRIETINAAMKENLLELRLIADYVSASSELSRGETASFVQEFGRLARRISAHERDLQVIGFIPSVPGRQRDSFETLLRTSVDAGFAIRDSSGNGTLKPSAPRESYFPIAVTEPEQYAGSVLGLDVASVPALNDSLRHALASGNATASAAVDLPFSEAQSRVVWVFRQVHRSARASDPTANRTGLLGVCVIAFPIRQMVHDALNTLSPAGIAVTVSDGAAPARLYELAEGPADTPGAVRVSGGISPRTRVLDVGERSWTVTAYPTTAFLSRHRPWQSYTILVGGLLLTALAAIVFLGRLRRTEQVEDEVAARTRELAEEISKHEALEKALAESRSTLTGQVNQLNEQNKQIQLLTDIGDALQSCLTVEEAYATVSRQVPRLLPGSSGTLFIHDAMKSLFLSAAEWGAHRSAIPAFKAEDCWALRRGKPHAVTAAGTNLPCPHAAGASEARSLCLPLSASGRTIGLLQVTGGAESAHAYAESVAEHVGLALSNIMLRSDLRQLSIHDPLTGLFNRRYMEESLETEIRRAERKKQPIGVIMLDIDHFKAFNDGFGHAAGDQMLRAIASLVQSRLRAGDIACRFGGEEMVLILPEATVEAARHRAEDLRARAKRLQVHHEDTPLGQVTISLGVAVYPTHAANRDELLGAADVALYKAKEEGRDRVAVVSTEPADD
ncbi:MAG TPA: diguanylate cyclase [Spirochaetia bacterium]|nr:diguanylate cyclase [Spirochaetia bacterium]